MIFSFESPSCLVISLSYFVFCSSYIYITTRDGWKLELKVWVGCFGLHCLVLSPPFTFGGSYPNLLKCLSSYICKIIGLSWLFWGGSCMVHLTNWYVILFPFFCFLPTAWLLWWISCLVFLYHVIISLFGHPYLDTCEIIFWSWKHKLAALFSPHRLVSVFFHWVISCVPRCCSISCHCLSFSLLIYMLNMLKELLFGLFISTEV